MYDVFLSYNSRDHSTVERVARALKERGLTVFLDRWYLSPGAPWPQRLEEILADCRAAAIFVGPFGMGGWQQREKYLALDRQVHEPAFPVIPVLLPNADPALGFLSLNTWVDLRHDLEDPRALQVLAEAVRGNPPGPDLQQKIAEALADVCPYRGLRFFREEDAPFFFGRASFVNRLAVTLGSHKLTAVVGASGSGKSSVVRAGLIPQLRQSESPVWGVATMVPGDQPLQSLAAALVPLLEPEMSEVDRLGEIKKLADHLAAGEISLRSVVSRALEIERGTDSLLLLVDQWEELYTLTRDDQIKKRFLEELLDATSSGQLSVILTLRGDFFDEVLNHQSFTDRLQDAVVNISPMRREELQQVIEGPAQKVGLQFEPGLVNRILDRVDGRPGNLPLLEFVLTELWREKRNGFLTHAAYDRMGEVEGAIATRAESSFEALSPDEREITRRIFLQLIQPGIHGDGHSPQEFDYTRRRTTFDEIGEEGRAVARKLADAHLVVTGRDNATGKEIIDIVHEALIRAWGRLRGWVEHERDFLLWRERLRAMMSFSAEGKNEDTLLKGVFLKEAKEWVSSHPLDLSSSEKTYIERSIKQSRLSIYWKVAQAGLVLLVLGLGSFFNPFRSGTTAPNVNGETDNTAQGTATPSGPEAPPPITPSEEIPVPAKYYRLAEGRKILYAIIHSSETNSAASFRSLIDYYHNMSGSVKSSVHYLIDREGKVAKLLDESKHVAFHITSSLDKVVSNDNSVGIMLMGLSTSSEGYTEKQVSALKELLKTLIPRYRINPANIIGHNEVPGAGRVDPGPKLDLNAIREEMKAAPQ